MLSYNSSALPHDVEMYITEIGSNLALRVLKTEHLRLRGRESNLDILPVAGVSEGDQLPSERRSRHQGNVTLCT